MSVVHTETMHLELSPERARAFVMTPERILDYFPQPVEGGVFEPGRAIWCRGEMGVSILECVPDECTDAVVVVRVTTAIGLDAPYTRERIEANATFVMIEDWEFVPDGDGTRLTKTWRDVSARGEPPFPLEDAVREGAIHETGALVEGWNRAARG